MTMSDRIAVVNRGRIEQVGTAAELYETPAHAFFAAFVGESNFLEGTVTSVNGGQAILQSAGGLRLTVDARAANVGDQCRVVIRPEALSIAADSMGRANAVSALIEDVIYLGDAIKIVARVNARDTLVIRRPNQRGVRYPEVGSRVTVAWAAEDVRVLPPPAKEG